MSKNSSSLGGQKTYVGKKELWMFSLGGLGQGMIYAMMSSYISDYYVNVLQLPLMFVLLLMLLARVWDAINDPLMGVIVDRHETKWGKYKPYILFIVFAALGGLVLYLIASEKIHIGFRGERVLAWINPEAYADGKGFQPIQSLYGIGSGGIWGKGLGKSIQKLGFLPEAHNDMIFSIICEELGLFGGLAIIIMFILMLWRIRDISSHITNTYENLLLCGVFTHIAMQVILNIAVVTNTIPNTGISLPFISYGGSSVIFLLAEIGIVMRVGRNCVFKEAPPVKKKRRIKEEETHEED